MSAQERLVNVKVLVAALVLLPCAAFGQEPPTPEYQLNLAEGGSVSYPLPVGSRVRFGVVNMVPARRADGDYRTEIQERFIAPDPFNFSAPTTSPAPAVAPPEPPCVVRKNEILAATTEQTVAMAVAAASAVKPQCTPEQLIALNGAIALTEWHHETPYTIQSDRELVLRVRRIANGTSEQEWTLTLSGPKRGTWSTSYGFNFLPSEDSRYFSAENPATPGTFIVTEQQDREELDFAPSAYFAWRSETQRAKKVPFGPTVGLGFDMDDPIVFAGVGWDVGQNFTFVVGGVFSKQSRLDGRYTPGQVIPTNLDEAQLEQQTFDLSYFLGFGFRFSSNPFGGGGEN